jgi:hypothetical protein
MSRFVIFDWLILRPPSWEILRCEGSQAETFVGLTSRFRALSHPNKVVRFKVEVRQLARHRFDTACEHRAEHHHSYRRSSGG